MEENDKHKLEGLLKARAQDLREGRRPRSRRPVTDPAPARTAASADGDERGSSRRCTDCGAEITLRRLRAMPRATRCLGCQRGAEAAVPRS